MREEPTIVLPLSQLAGDAKPQAAMQGFRRVPDKATEHLHVRSRHQVAGLFGDLELVPPYRGPGQNSATQAHGVLRTRCSPAATGPGGRTAEWRGSGDHATAGPKLPGRQGGLPGEFPPDPGSFRARQQAGSGLRGPMIDRDHAAAAPAGCGLGWETASPLPVKDPSISMLLYMS